MFIFKFIELTIKKGIRTKAVIDFKCPSDGLFAHPNNCYLFLQCIDVNTLHVRFYIRNCPNQLYFNDKTKACDYPFNVPCLI
jgi:hypothetical protein